MKIKLTQDEAYRIFIANDDDSFGEIVEIPDDLLKQFIAADEKFREIEGKVYELYKQQTK